MSVFHRSVLLAAAAAIPALAACSTEPSQSKAERAAMIEARKGAEVSSVCFAGQIDSFSTTGRNAVVVRTSPRDEYLLQTTSCFNLDNAMSLEIENRSSCLSRGDNIIAYDSVFGDDGTGMQPSRCLITGMYEWKSEAEVEAEMTADETM